MNDEFGRGLERMLRDIERRLQRLEAAQRSGPGLTIGKASGAFNLPTTLGAARPDDGASLYHDGSTLRYVDSAGNDRPLGGVGQVDRPQYPSSFASPATITTNPTSDHYNLLRADCAMLQVCVRDVINKGAEIPLWPTS